MQRLALVVVEFGPGIVLIHPLGGPTDAPASLPSGIVLDGETPEEGALRLVHDQTGLHVAITKRLVEFEQEGTPYGTAAMTGFVARVVHGRERCTAKKYSQRRRPGPTSADRASTIPTPADYNRPLARNSKTEGRGFESFRPCQPLIDTLVFRIGSISGSLSAADSHTKYSQRYSQQIAKTLARD